MDHEKLYKKYPKAMLALRILTMSQQANPLKPLRAISEGKRQYSEADMEKFLAAAEKWINEGMDPNKPVRTFSEVKTVS